MAERTLAERLRDRLWLARRESDGGAWVSAGTLEEAVAALERLEKLEAAAMSVLENRRREKRTNSTLGTLFRVVAILHYVLAATAVPDTDRLFARLTVGLCFAILGILHDDRAARKQGGEVNHG